ncbi:MAG: PHP domain-containing protein [Clostridiaceae bacterium]
MDIYTDFHIHTALSPCGDEDMTPNNIVSMALIKGLDAIAITDHNSVENVLPCMEVGKEKGLLVIPGMELQTREEVHVVCLFPDFDAAMAFQEYVYSKLPPLKNSVSLFGEQLIFDRNDEVIRHTSRLLLTSADMTINDAYFKVNELNGAFIPAHIDRDAYGIISALGFIPQDLPIHTLEYRSKEGLNRLISSGLVSKNFNFIQSSDAHYLQDISERQNVITVDELKTINIINKLK